MRVSVEHKKCEKRETEDQNGEATIKKNGKQEKRENREKANKRTSERAPTMGKKAMLFHTPPSLYRALSRSAHFSLFEHRTTLITIELYQTPHFPLLTVRACDGLRTKT